MNWNDNVNTKDGHKVKLADFIKSASGISEIAGITTFNIKGNSKTYTIDVKIADRSEQPFFVYAILSYYLKNDEGFDWHMGYFYDYKDSGASNSIIAHDSTTSIENGSPEVTAVSDGVKFTLDINRDTVNGVDFEIQGFVFAQ